MTAFSKNDRETLRQCPWCGNKNYKNWGRPVRGFYSAECAGCGLVYVKNRLNKNGLEKFYREYISDIHQADMELNKKREKMYKIEFDLINSYCAKGDVLDVGCSGGYFLDHFKKAGFKCYGVEFGEKAAEEAMKKYKVYFGDFAKLKIGKKFDLIIFRGVIEHIPFPKLYLKKALDLLKDKGFIYITSTPNSESFCCRLFHERWNLHTPEEHLMHFSPKHFDSFFLKNGLKKIAERYYYEETPYADTENDLIAVARAAALRKKAKPVNFNSPAFHRNMMSLIYKRG